MKVALILFDVDLKDFNLESYYTIGVDKGALNASLSNIHLDLAIGDFDSVTEDEFDIIKNNSNNIIKLNPIKDTTDTEEALKNALKISDDITIFGGISGKRIEHFLSILSLFNKYSKLHIVDNNSHIFLIDKNFIIKKNEYKYISFFSLDNNLILSLKGFKYELSNYNLKMFDPLCVSNEFVKDIGKIEANNKLLVVLSKSDNLFD